MKLSIVKNALAMYTAHGEWDDETTAEINSCWSELEEMEKVAPDDEYCEDVTIIPTTLMIDFGNQMWYDTFGRTARKLGYTNMTVDDFITAVRREEYCTEVSKVVLEDIYELVHDLWFENEAEGSNRLDGSYCKYLADDDYQLIQEVLCDKLDEVGSGEQYEAFMQAKRRLTAMFNDKWTTFCGRETCDKCDGQACRPC